MILTGLQIALAAAFSTVVSAELLAATNGLGWMVISASTFLRNDIIILCILMLGRAGRHAGGAAAGAGQMGDPLAGPRLMRDAARLGDHRAVRAAGGRRAGSAMTSGGLVRDLFLPGPLDVWSGLTELIDEGYKGRPLLLHVGMSLYRVGAGFVTGALVGTLLGLGMGTCRG